MSEKENLEGIKDGVFKKYSYDGISAESEYSEGKKEKLWFNYYSHGQVKSEGIYKKGHKEGEWKYYNRKDDLINAIIFKGGLDVKAIKAAEKKTVADKKDIEEKQKDRTHEMQKLFAGYLANPLPEKAVKHIEYVEGEVIESDTPPSTQ